MPSEPGLSPGWFSFAPLSYEWKRLPPSLVREVRWLQLFAVAATLLPSAEFTVALVDRSWVVGLLAPITLLPMLGWAAIWSYGLRQRADAAMGAITSPNAATPDAATRAYRRRVLIAGGMVACSCAALVVHLLAHS